MICKTTQDSSWPGDLVVGIASSLSHGDVPTIQTAPTGDLRAVELTSANAWSELIRDIVAVANTGGGRLVVRCVPSGDMAAPIGREFSMPVLPAARSELEKSQPAAQRMVSPNLQPVRIVTDPNAPALQPQDVDRLYPWRQKDLLRELNRRLGRRLLNSYDLQAVRRQHHLDARPDFVFNLPGAGRRYSPAVADWIMEQHGRDPEFFHRARAADHEVMALRRHKPK